MGIVVSKAADGVGALLGNVFVAPIKTIFGRSCNDVCSGTWDITCFIEHLCVSNLVQLLMVLGLCYITLMFLYVLFKLGICQCIGRSLCKMCWGACETYWIALEDITCFLWYKLKNVKRVNRRRRFRDVEVGYTSSSRESKFVDDDRSLSIIRKRKLTRERRKDRWQSSLHYPLTLRQGSKDRHRHHHHHHHHHHSRLKSRQVSGRVKDRSQGLKNLRQLQIREASNVRREAALFKRRG